MEHFETIFAERVIRYRWWIIIATLLCVALAASGLQRLTFNDDLRTAFSEDNPQLAALEALESSYTKTENILFILAPKSGDIFTADALTAIEALTHDAWQTPYSNRVDSITNFQYSRADGDVLIISDLVRNARALSTDELARVRNVAFAEPSLINRLLSPTGHVTSVNINIIMPGKATNEVEAVTAFSRQLRDTYRQNYPDIEIYLTGSVMFDAAFSEVGQRDMTILAPAMFLVLMLVIGYALRSIAATIATLLVILFSTFTALGLAGWLGIEITPPSANAPAIILTLAIADSIHILVTLCRLSCAGQPKHKAIIESLQVNLQAVFLTSVTTIIGFLFMNFSDVPPFHDLGNIVAMGVAAAFFYSVVFLPAFMAVLPVRIKLKATESGVLLDRLATFVIRRQQLLFAGSLGLAAILTLGIIRIELNDDWINYFSADFPVRKATDFMEAHLSGADYIDYSLPANGPGGISEREYLEKVDAFADWFRTQPDVFHVITYTDVAKRLNKNMHGDDETWYRVPDQRNLAAQYLLLYEMSLPYGLDLNNQINIDKSATRMTVFIKSLGTRKLREMDDRAQAWLKQNAPKYMHTEGTGLSIIWAYLSGRNIVSMLIASFGALILISFLLIAALRSVKLGLVSLVPNLAPATMAFGIWGLWFGEIGIGLSIVVSMTLGIVVDDTVHFISKFLRAYRRDKKSSTESIRYAFATVGTAMWVTTVALVAGFLVLMFSTYKMSADMGLFSAITISLALLMDFLLLPILILKVTNNRGAGPTVSTS